MLMDNNLGAGRHSGYECECVPAISPKMRGQATYACDQPRLHASDQPVQVSTLLFAESYYAVSTSTRNKEAASAMKENNFERNRVIRRVVE